MKAFKNYEDAKKRAAASGVRIPKGAYVCKILGVKYTEPTSNCNGYITIQYDIDEGEFKDFYQNAYKADTNPDKKYKGTETIWEPKEDGSESDEWTQTAFARWINAFEASNTNFHWDWDEQKLRGLLIGIVYGDIGTVINGKEVLYVGPSSVCSVDQVRDGSYYKPKLKKRKGYTGNGSSASQTESNEFMAADDNMPEEIPFL